MKILLLGARGQVGFELARSLAPLGEVICVTREGVLESGEACLGVDLADPMVLTDTLHDIAPEIVVNAAAYTAVDRAEDEAPLADRINHGVLAVLGAWAARTGALVVHYSTDYVFDGRGNCAYREDDITAPLGIYGQTKLAGENALRDSGCSYLILRTAWVFAARGKNFLRTMLRVGRERDALSVVDDQRGAPTSARLIADTTAIVLARWIDAETQARERLNGTYHLSAAGSCSWHEFAVAIFASAVRAQLLERAPSVVAIVTSQYPTRAQRPAFSVLDTAKLRDTFRLHLPDWKHGLEAVIGELAVAATK